MRKAAVILVVAALAVAACGKSGDRSAATVNDVVITDNDVLAELKGIRANAQFVSQEESKGGKVNGTTPGSFDPGFAAQVLVNQMDYELIRQEVARRKLPISSQCLAKTRNNLYTDLGDGTASTGEGVFNAFPKAYQDSILARRASVLVLQSDLAHEQCGAPDAAATFYANHPDQFARTCLSAIIVDDAATANDIVNRARAGEDFAALAQQYSTDEQSKAAGGDVGCHLPNELPETLAPVIAAAQTGDVTDPLQSESGQVFFKVGTKDVAPLDEVQTQADELADQDLVKAFRVWLQTAETQARINVDRRYGSFDQTKFSITPPESAPATDTSIAPTPTTTP